MNEVEITLTYREWKEVAERLRRRDPLCTVASMLTDWAEVSTSGDPEPGEYEPIKMGLSRTSAFKVLEVLGKVVVVAVT